METFGCVIGAAYADALGKATEFLTKYQIYKIYGESGRIQLGVVHNGEHRNAWDPYDWTDDNDQSEQQYFSDPNRFFDDYIEILLCFLPVLPYSLRHLCKVIFPFKVRNL